MMMVCTLRRYPVLVCIMSFMTLHGSGQFAANDACVLNK